MAQSITSRWKLPPLDSPWQGEKVDYISNVPGFPGVTQVTDFGIARLGAIETWHTRDAWELLKTREMRGLLLLQRALNAANRDWHSSAAYSSRKKEEWSMHPALRFLRELPQGLVFLPQLGAMMEHSTLYKPGNNRAGTFTETPENLQCHRQKSEGSRNYLQTEGHSKTPNLNAKIKKTCTHRKGLRGPQNLEQG